MIGDRLGHYRVVAPLGAGGMGVVYCAYDEVLQRDVAIKLVPPEAEGDARARSRLLREARMASSLQHANICTVFEVAEDKGRTFIVMELVRGRTLAEILREGPLDTATACRLGEQIASALAHAHEHGVIHRDLKSANVIVTDAGVAKVLDFGLARRDARRSDAPTASMTATVAVAGTAAYMAPEAFLGGDPDAATDIWSLGVVLYEMCAGFQPFAGSTWFELSSAVIHGAPKPLPPRVPPWLRELIGGCLEKDRARRFSRVEDVLSALATQAAGAKHGRSTPRRGVPRRAVVAFALTALAAVGAIVVSRILPGSSPDSIRSLAVLPLDNLTGDPRQDYFADGMTDELITTLSRLPGLRVISRTSVMRYRGARKRPRDIARELGVDAIIEGSVARGADQVRVSATLVRGSNDQNLWANEYRRRLSDVLTLQGDIAQAVAQQIKLTLTPAAAAVVTRRRAVNPDAYDAVLRGREALNSPTRTNALRARAFFEKAIAIDSTMAPAYAGLTRSLLQLGDFDGDSRPYMRRGHAAALRAVALDDRLPEAHSALALVFTEWDSDWPRAFREFQRAVSLDPNNVEAHLQLGFYYRYRGESTRDREEMRVATVLDPLSGYGVIQLAWAELFARRYEDSARMFGTALVVDSTSTPGREGLGLALEQLGQYEQAIQELSRASRSERVPAYLCSLGHALGVGGRRNEAQAILDTLRSPGANFTPAPEDLALVQLGLGQKEEALRNVEASAKEHTGAWIQFIRVDPRLDPVRSTPLFRRALSYMRLSDDDVQAPGPGGAGR